MRHTAWTVLAAVSVALVGTCSLAGAPRPSPLRAVAVQTQAPPSASAPPATGNSEFTLAAAEAVVTRLRHGLVAQSRRRTLALFDRNMPGYDGLGDQLTSLFTRYDTIRVYAHTLRTGVEAGTATADVQFTMEAAPPDPSLVPVRHTAELRLTFRHSGKDWKIVKLEPADFFARF